VPLTPSANVVSTSLRQCAGAGRELGRNNCVRRDPVGERIFTVLDDGLASLISVIGLASLTRSNRSIIDKLEQVLSVAGNDGNLLAVLTESIELVGIGSLNLLAGDVRKLCLSNKRLSLSSDKFLLENNDLGRVRLLVLELSNLVGNLLLACNKNLAFCIRDEKRKTKLGSPHGHG
jgi:hypothetical protein